MVNLYIWEDVDPISSNYHDGGGLAIIAANLDRARELWAEQGYGDGATKGAPDHAFTVGKADERVIRFPDAGCC